MVDAHSDLVHGTPTSPRTPELWVSATDIGKDPGEEGYNANVAGRPDTPFKTIQAAIDFLATLGREGGTIRLRVGPEVSYDSPVGSGEIHELQWPIQLIVPGRTSLKYLRIVGGGGSGITSARRQMCSFGLAITSLKPVPGRTPRVGRRSTLWVRAGPS